MSAEYTHGASHLSQWEACPGSAFAQAGLTDEDSEDSKEGTSLHAHDADQSIDRSELTGEQLDVLKYAEEGDEAIFAGVRASLDIGPDEPFEEGREDERWFRRGLKALFPGHNDRWRHYPGRKVLVIIDKKFGRNPVDEADSNRQLMAYGVMGADEFDPDHVLVAINQPRLPYNQRLTIGEYNRESIKAAKELILSIWDGSHNKDGSPREDAPRVAGEDQCRYCKARLHCDAYRAKYEFLAKPAADGKDAFVARLEQLTDDELDKVFVACKFAGLIEASAKQEIIHRIEGGKMGHYELKPGNKNSKITDPVAAVRLLHGLGLTTDAIIARSKLSLEDISEDVRTLKGITQKDAKILVKETVSPVLEIGQNAPSLKRTGEPQGKLT
jgi:hypothetical protein